MFGANLYLLLTLYCNISVTYLLYDVPQQLKIHNENKCAQMANSVNDNGENENEKHEK